MTTEPHARRRGWPDLDRLLIGAGALGIVAVLVIALVNVLGS